VVLLYMESSYFEYGRSVTDRPENEHRYQALVTDQDGVICRWDSACVRVFGHSSEEAIGETLDLVVPPALQARHWPDALPFKS
jgi:PAS domain-containing protein